MRNLHQGSPQPQQQIRAAHRHRKPSRGQNTTRNRKRNPTAKRKRSPQQRHRHHQVSKPLNKQNRQAPAHPRRRAHVHVSVAPIVNTIPLSQLHPNRIHVIRGHVLHNSKHAKASPHSTTATHLARDVLGATLNSTVTRKLVSQGPTTLARIPRARPIRVTVLAAKRTTQLVTLRPSAG